MDFTNLKDLLMLSYEVTWTAQYSPPALIADRIRLTLLRMQKRKSRCLCPKIAAGKGFLKLSYIQTAALPLVPEGHLLGFVN